ncbi:MAG TPA: acyl-CoA dehydrogenase family protein [Acidimicrobiales bacterium]|nr:acyl-CoA dehydrogenase family protein [Acidimicrobiales bacterium]
MSESRTLDGPSTARGLREVMAEEAGRSEEGRTLTPRAVDALWSSGLMQWYNPAEAGGAEPSFAEMIETWIELAWQDGSLGWIGIANFPSAASSAAYLSDDGFKELFVEHDNRVTMGGQFFPNGLGEDTGDAYRITGSWNFGSGTGHSQYVAAGFIPTVGGEMVNDENGIPRLMVALIPHDEVTFTDGWFVQGLRGTGSYDYNVKDHLVPKRRTYGLFDRTPLRGKSAAFQLGLIPITAAGHASWALGVSKSMLDDVTELARTKVRMGDDASIAHRGTFQKGLSHHRAAWWAAKLLVVDTFSHVERAVLAGDELTPTMRAELRVAATYATEVSRELAEWAHLSAGTSAIRDGSRLERAFRDMYTGTQHVFIGEKTYIDAAQIFLGLTEDQFGF